MDKEISNFLDPIYKRLNHIQQVFEEIVDSGKVIFFKFLLLTKICNFYFIAINLFFEVKDTKYKKILTVTFKSEI